MVYDFSNRFASYKMTEPPKGIINNFQEIPEYEPQNSSSQEYLISEEVNMPRAQRITKQINQKNKDTKVKQNVPQSFKEAYEQALKINPEVQQYKDFLFRTAKRESNFKNIQNTSGAPYYGFFQMGKNEIKTTLGISVNEFKNDPVSQILGAVKLYKINMKTAKSTGVYNLCKQKGYSDDAIISGAWAGGVGGVKKFITGAGDPSDYHWYSNGGGTSVGKVMNDWMKNE